MARDLVRKAANAKRYRAKYYIKNREAIRKNDADRLRLYGHKKRASAVLYRRRLRAAVILKYGGKCKCCGEAQIEFLTIDHHKGGGTLDRNSAGGTWGMYLKILKAPNSSVYRVLCWNCNCGRANNGGICPHKKPKH